MEKLIEYINPNSHSVQLLSPDHKQLITVPANSRVILSEWYKDRYCPQFIKVVRVVGESQSQSDLKPNASPIINPPPPRGRTPIVIPVKHATPSIPQIARSPQSMMQSQVVRNSQPEKALPISRSGVPRLAPNVAPQPLPVVPIKSANNIRQIRAPLQYPPVTISPPIIHTPPPAPPLRSQHKIVGRSKAAGHSEMRKTYQSDIWAISDNIGIGILSFNRLSSIQRLIVSIRAHTDLSRTTIFVSDESTDQNVKDWLKSQNDLIVLTDQPRLGVAGNSNRLLRCLKRFKYAFLLNDDVEILNDDWEDFYIREGTGYHHFCFRQPGLYGASRSKVNGKIITITEKPHGAIMFFSNEAFQCVGYMDEQFGFYGMEHVDWSNRVSLSGIQPPGFHDIVGSDRYFVIHNEKSVVNDKHTQLHNAKQRYDKISQDTSRIYIEPTETSIVPAISVVIPIRDLNRTGSIETVVNSIRTQFFPDIEIIIIEQDYETKAYDSNLLEKLRPSKFLLAKSAYQNQPFVKSKAFNFGVAQAINKKIVLHDADMIAPRSYLKKIYDMLDTYEGLHIGKSVLYLSRAATTSVVETCHLSENLECERIVEYFEGGSLACTRDAYYKVGGFNEVYEGYGIEDCDFFNRLISSTKFYNDRTLSLIHLWHDKISGWETCHEQNKRRFEEIKRQYNISSNADSSGFNRYAADLARQLSINYPLNV